MRQVNFLICRSESKRTLADQKFQDGYLSLIDPEYQNRPRRWVVCDGCGFVYHDPQLDDKDQKVLYDHFRDESLRNETPDAYFDRITSLPRNQSENGAKADWIKAHAPELIRKKGKLLDIGCGGGVFIHTFLNNFPDWSAYGVEPTTSFAELAQRRLKVPVVSGIYRPGLFPRTSFDLVTINQVLEHLVDPIGFLEEVRTELNPGGMIYLETPNVKDFSHLPLDHDRFFMQHLWFFSRASLTNVCRLAGFEVVSLEEQFTIRERNNLVLLIRPSPAAVNGGKLIRDNVEDILSLVSSRCSR